MLLLLVPCVVLCVFLHLLACCSFVCLVCFVGLVGMGGLLVVLTYFDGVDRVFLLVLFLCAWVLLDLILIH